MSAPVIVVGAGLSGLAAARRLSANFGADTSVYPAQEDAGNR